MSGEVLQRNKAWKAAAYVIMIFFTFVTLGPLVWLFYSSFKPHTEIVRNSFSLPRALYLKNYAEAWRLAHLGILILNSIFYSTVTTLMVTLLALATGYGFAKFRYRVSRVFFYFYTLGLLIVVHSVLVPLFVMETRLKIDDTRLGVLVPYVAFGLPFMVFLAYSYIRGIPDSLQEAAVIDGASYLLIFRQIIVPISAPVTATMLIFSFLSTWNELVLMLTLTSDEALRSLPAGLLSFSSGRTQNYGLQLAALVIATGPMIVFYAAFHNQLAKGFAAGALKE
jgi:raffinose/stachyose/melibiose transport system permease protein